MSYGNIHLAHLGFNAWVVAALYLDDPLSEIHQVVRSVVNEMRDFDSKSVLAFLLPSWQIVSLYVSTFIYSWIFSHFYLPQLLNLSGDVFNHDPSQLEVKH
jgi:hypothetical protein